jgi:guanylate kinase
VSGKAKRRGVPFVVSAPSGTGKTTVCRLALEQDPGLVFSISHTTRKPREGERDGLDYHFVGDDEFRELVASGAFVEHAEYAGRCYGTSWSSLEAPLEAGLDLLLEIEVQGAAQVREAREDARFVFLLPPSMPILEQRLRGRGTDSDEVIAARLALSQHELEAVRFFDYAIVNDVLDESVAALLEIVAGERNGEVGELRARYGREVVLEAWRGDAGLR